MTALIGHQSHEREFTCMRMKAKVEGQAQMVKA